MDSKVVRTRPLCPYPQVARHWASSSIDEAARFCLPPHREADYCPGQAGGKRCRMARRWWSLGQHDRKKSTTPAISRNAGALGRH